MDPRPDINERIVWGVERQGVKPFPMPKPYPRVRFWLFQLYAWGLGAYGLSVGWKHAPRDETGAVIFSEFLASLVWPLGFMIVAVAAIFIILKLVNSPPRINQTKKALPLWLSDSRLAYVPAEKQFGATLPLGDIQTAGLDYITGSLAVRLKTPTDTLHLLTSDAELLLRNLFSLRPELEPTS